MHLINELGVSPEVEMASFLECMVATTWGLAEKQSGIGISSPSKAEREHAELTAQGVLPPHLQEKGAFMQRYSELVGLTPEGMRDSEVAATIVRNRHRPDPSVERRFEEHVGQLLSFFVTLAADRQFSKQAQTLSVFTLEHVEGAGKCLTTRRGIQARLPLNHAGIVQLAPGVNDALARFHEAQAGGNWATVALVNNNPFNEAFNRSIAAEMYGLAAKRVVTISEGSAGGIETLIEQKQRNKSLKVGFGAIVLSAVGHLPIDEVKVFIERSPELLARGGVLGISDVENFGDDRGGVWDLIGTAREAFGSSHEDIRLMVADNGQEGRQAVFKKTTK